MAAALPVFAANQSVPAAIEALKSRDLQVKHEAMTALQQAGPAALPEMVAAMSDRRLRLALIQVCAAMGPKAAPKLLAIMKSDPAKRDDAGQLLVQVAPQAPAVIPELLSCVKDGSLKHYCGMALARSLGPAQKARAPQLIALLKNADPDVRIYAAVGLGQLGGKGPQTQQALETCAGDEASKVREACQAALKKLGWAGKPEEGAE